jgi:hypothetical protein
MTVPAELYAYLESGLPQVCEIDTQPWLCEFWPLGELELWNKEYEVSVYAPGYFGFATSGGGEMYAFSPQGAIVCLPFIGMSPREELLVAWSWGDFKDMLRGAV